MTVLVGQIVDSALAPAWGSRPHQSNDVLFDLVENRPFPDKIGAGPFGVP